MFPLTEAQILRTMAVACLAVALLVSAFILFNSGIIGGSPSPSGAVEPLDAAAGAAPAPETTTTPTQAAGAATIAAEASPAATVATTATTPSGNTYIVQSGDSFYTIARKYNTSIAQIQQLNPDLDTSNLATGTSVNVP